MDSPIPESLKLAGVTFLRYLVAAACSWLVAHKVIDDGTSKALMDPVTIMFLGGFLLTALTGVYMRLRGRFYTNVALALPANSTRADVNQVASDASIKTILSTTPL